MYKSDPQELIGAILMEEVIMEVEVKVRGKDDNYHENADITC